MVARRTCRWPERARWRIVPLATSLTIAAALAATWLWPPTRASWNQLDLLVFRTLNQTLAWGTVWQHLWVLCNWRGFDVVSGGIMLALLVHALRQQKGIQRPAQVWISLSLLAVAILGARYLFGDLLIEKTLAYHRPSPTKVLDNCWRLSVLVPQIEAKDTSYRSFPGDHGFVLLSIALYISYWGTSRAARAAWWLAALFALPRLVAGAHWLTDVAVGSGCMALVTVSLLMATPLHGWLVGRLSSTLKLSAGGGCEAGGDQTAVSTL